jgi:tetratricopeptide (TPR) repeat protein
MKRRAAVVLGTTLVAGVSAASAATLTDLMDQQERIKMSNQGPHAIALLAKGEALMASGAFQEAQILFQQAHSEYPNASLPWRRDCEALTALGRRSDAILRCSDAMQILRDGTNARALVSAFIDGPVPPTTEELSQAVMATAGERSKGRGPTPAAMACDIAERIQDMVMLQHCAKELEIMAPEDPATRKALDVLDAQCPPLRFWGGWVAILAAFAATVSHALRRLLVRRPSARASALAGVGLWFLLCAFARTSTAQEQQAPEHGMMSNWHVDDDHPDAHIPSEKDRNANPLQFGYWLQDLALKGEHASKRGDHAAAVKFYSTLTQAVPDRAIGFVKTCEEYKALGELDNAINACGQALLRDGLRVRDYTLFTDLLLSKPGKLIDKEVAALGQVVAHMRADPGGKDAVDEVECEVGARTSNVKQLEECTLGLSQRSPNDVTTLSYLWSLAIARHDYGEAERVIEKARSAGTAPGSIANMERVTAIRTREHLYRVLLAVLAVGFLAVGVGVAGNAFRRHRAVKASEGGPRPPRTELQVPG